MAALEISAEERAWDPALTIARRQRLHSAAFSPTTLRTAHPPRREAVLDRYPYPIGPVNRPLWLTAEDQIFPMKVFTPPENPHYPLGRPRLMFTNERLIENRVPWPVKERPLIAHRFVRAIIEAIAEAFGVTAMELLSSRRQRAFVIPRQIACYCIAKRTSWSLPRIGAAMGGLDHTTIIHASRRVEKWILLGVLTDPLPFLFPTSEENEHADVDA